MTDKDYQEAIKRFDHGASYSEISDLFMVNEKVLANECVTGYHQHDYLANPDTPLSALGGLK